jgi:hypothetical protein
MKFHRLNTNANIAAWILCLIVISVMVQKTLAQDSFRLTGDLRLRGEMDRDRRNAPDRERGRMRFRTAGEIRFGSTFTIGARLVTAPDASDPNSTHQNLGTGFHDFRVALDRAYLRWTPTMTIPFEMFAGKFDNPFLRTPLYGELVWDADVQPEGIAMILEPLPPLRLAAGGYLLLHQGNGKDVNVGSAQLALRSSQRNVLQLTAAIGGYFFGNPDRSAGFRLAQENQGNTLLINSAGDTLGFASQFAIWNGFVTATFNVFSIPMTSVFEYMNNPSAEVQHNRNGLAWGASIGRINRPGTWKLSYQFQSIGRESIFSPLGQDDFLDTTNFRGHLLGLTIKFLPTADINFWTLWSAKVNPREETFQKRFRIDLNFFWSAR